VAAVAAGLGICLLGLGIAVAQGRRGCPGVVAVDAAVLQSKGQMLGRLGVSQRRSLLGLSVGRGVGSRCLGSMLDTVVGLAEQFLGQVPSRMVV